jgi:hypothetical protein
MTSFARQVRRRHEKSIEGRLTRIGVAKPNFEVTPDVPESATKDRENVTLKGPKIPANPRKLKRTRAKAARKRNRGAYSGR